MHIKKLGCCCSMSLHPASMTCRMHAPSCSLVMISSYQTAYLIINTTTTVAAGTLSTNIWMSKGDGRKARWKFSLSSGRLTETELAKSCPGCLRV